ncbi:hypothetical protein FPQ18DRAFT_275184 [Pyronema domesticum]|uniref:Uncharacterized protein n=1 Tax=Pyronema omphalodes (strain CBS 100304) TaxID=1076935 RepID=U4L8F9_PYROM|nr:hypothetical protein FPQ18DRAFT_275184 [Pyronema domesticum]CCX09658.1 Similar to hypothetical protein [Tuber melanosporum Mel28]; acc. no. XP_002835279 [Pyronema omphalodes CBS 100304]
MSAPYIRTGRGGAGNHIPAEEARSEDLEAAKEGGVANAMAADQMMEATPGEYKHTGRGGAGNYYEPSNLQQTGTIEPVIEDHEPSTEQPAIRQWTGRGGAGNFAASHGPTPEEIEAKEREQAKKLQEEVRKSVESSLPKPMGAHLGGRKAL